MKTKAIIFLFSYLFILSIPVLSQSNPKVIHVYVALCDRASQGIISSNPALEDGDKPGTNQYWGALYGVRSFLSRSPNWTLVKTTQNPANNILERCIFQHRSKKAWLVADAYRGSAIRTTINDFLSAAAGGDAEPININIHTDQVTFECGGGSDLIAYIGHNGLMDFSLLSVPNRKSNDLPDSIILACRSKAYFEPIFRNLKSEPILWTTNLMAPEAYTLDAALEAWIMGETREEIRDQAARAYQKYQRCSLSAAKRILVTGWRDR